MVLRATALEILEAARGGELSRDAAATAAEVGVKTADDTLRALRAVGLLKTRHDGRRIYYALTREGSGLIDRGAQARIQG